MIQAPNMQYIPAQQPVMPMPQMTGANYGVPQMPQQMPGVIYNYPTTSCYSTPQSYSTDKAQYNGVNIEIVNPQGQAVQGAQTAQPYMPAQFVPIQQPMVAPFPTAQTIVQAPQMPTPAPMPQVPQQPVPEPQIQPAQPQAVAPQTTTETPQAAAPVIEQPTSPDASKTAESFAGKLKTDDVKAQQSTIEEIAETVKDQNNVLGNDLLDTQIYDALVDIINKDTSSLQGPSPEVLELRSKDKDSLTEEEKTKAMTPSPLEEAEINKQYALYTISYMNERLNSELEKGNGQPLAFQDLPCIEKLIDTAKSNENPRLRVSALAALSHIQRPEYKESLGTIFTLAQKDENEKVQEAATKALTQLNA